MLLRIMVVGLDKTVLTSHREVKYIQGNSKICDWILKSCKITTIMWIFCLLLKTVGS